MKKKIKRIKNWFYSKRLKERVRLLFLMIAIAYIAIFFLTYSFFIKRNILDYILDSNYNSMVSIGNNLNIEFNTVSTMSQLIMTNSNVRSYLKEPVDKDSRLSQNAIRSMYDISNTFKYVSSIYVFKTDGEYINIGKEVTYLNRNIMNDPKWQREIVENAGLYVIRINGDGAFKTKRGTSVISFVRLINDLDTQKPIGLIAVNLTTDILKNSYKDMATKDRHFSYYDKEGRIFFKGEEVEEFDKMEINKEKFEQISAGGFFSTKIFSYYQVPNTPFTLSKSEKVSFTKYISPQALITIAIVLILTILCLGIIIIFISVYITKPIERLVQYMDVTKTGWYKKGMKSKYFPKNEISYFKKDNKMLIEFNRIIDELLDKEKAMQKAELEVLREQINPHFLYNTLGTIADLALQSSAHEVYDAIETLGNFYRKFLSKGSKEISIREEVGIVKDYLKLQKLRYEEVFEDEYDVQEDLLDIKIPKLILQPLVENSLYHGVRLKGEKGIIKVCVYSEDNTLHIVIYDSGIGMDADQIHSMMNNDNKKSFGFKGTMERIRYYYDTEDVFDIRSEVGVYCEVDIKIPL